MRYLCLLLIMAGCFSTPLSAQKNDKPEVLKRPKLVVGIVVDQMRYDYLYRYYNKYSERGFKRLIHDGFNCRNNHYHYALTITAAGHASIYTGSAPSVHGIIGNDWYDKKLGKKMYCVADTAVQTIGSSNISAGKMSPKNLKVSTITDQLRIGTSFQSKVIGIALKDRGAILPAGHTANAAYWFDGKTGNWITSSFYRNDLPQWLSDYNNRKRPAELLSSGWKTLLPVEQYTESTIDAKDYEFKFPGAAKPVFPYDLAGVAGDAYGILSSTPHGNTLTKEVAIEAIKNEGLGKGNSCDFLAISFSAPDYVGHAFGPTSVEQEDCYLKLDMDMAEILEHLDKTLGKGNYLVFLTADHGVMDVTDWWNENHLPAGRMNIQSMMTGVKKALKDRFGDGEFITASENFQLYLNMNLLNAKNIKIEEVHKVVRNAMLDFEGIAEVLNLHDLAHANLNDYLLTLYKNVNHSKRSGDLQLVGEPGWMAGPIAANHGTPYNNDTHVPLLFYGWGIKSGETFRRTAVADTAPTIAALLSILEPNGNIGEVIEEIFRK